MKIRIDDDVDQRQLLLQIASIETGLNTGEGWKDCDQKLRAQLNELMALAKDEIKKKGLGYDQKGYEFDVDKIRAALDELDRVVERLSGDRRQTKQNDDSDPYLQLKRTVESLGESFDRRVNDGYFRRKRRKSIIKGILGSVALCAVVAAIIVVPILFIFPAIAGASLGIYAISSLAICGAWLGGLASLTFIPAGMIEMVRDYRKMRNKTKPCDEIGKKVREVSSLANTASLYENMASADKVRGQIDVDCERKIEKIQWELKFSEGKLIELETQIQLRQSSVEQLVQRLETALAQLGVLIPGTNLTPDTVTLSDIERVAKEALIPSNNQNLVIAKTLVSQRDEFRQMSATLELYSKRQEMLQEKLSKLTRDDYVNTKFEKYKQTLIPVTSEPKSRDRFTPRLKSTTREKGRLDKRTYSTTDLFLFTPFSKGITRELAKMAVDAKLLTHDEHRAVINSMN